MCLREPSTAVHVASALLSMHFCGIPVRKGEAFGGHKLRALSQLTVHCHGLRGPCRPERLFLGPTAAPAVGAQGAACAARALTAEAAGSVSSAGAHCAQNSASAPVSPTTACAAVRARMTSSAAQSSSQARS